MDIKTPLTTVLLLLSFLGLGACDEPLPPVAVHSRPVKTMVVSGISDTDTRSFPAIVDAIQKADISFRVRGKIQKILVKEGDKVSRGQLLAELDPTDFRIRLKDREASYKTAKANYDRAKTLVEKGAISKVDHDNIRAKFFTAKANLDEAKQDMAYTKLKASFDGFIAKRYVDNFEEVLASQTIFSLEDTSALKLIIDVPENLMIAIDKDRSGTRKLFARFDTIKDRSFPLKFVEATTKADEITKTFKVTLKMDKPPAYNILPGMTATVYAQILPSEITATQNIPLPVSAVVANSKKQATVWVVDEETMTVHPQKVTTGFLAGDTIQVSGVEAGERVVTAGAAFLRDGMKVTLLQTGEQPE